MEPDIRVGTKFTAVDISSYYGVVEAIDGDEACVRYFTCFSSGREKVPLRWLANPKMFRLEDP